MRDRKNERQDGHDEFRVRRLYDGSGVWNKTGTVSCVRGVCGDGGVFRDYGQDNGTLRYVPIYRTCDEQMKTLQLQFGRHGGYFPLSCKGMLPTQLHRPCSSYFVVHLLF